MSKLRPNTRSLALALPIFLLFLFNAAPINNYDAQADVRAERWTYISSEEEVSHVLEVLRGYHTGISSAEEERLAEVIVGHSNAYSIDPYFVLALIKKESTFNNWARSRVGALGLMQIRPTTGRAIARELGFKWRGEKTLFDPSMNVKLGIHYLSGLRERFDQDMKVALAAYNHGPANLSWRLRTGKKTHFHFVEKIYSDYASFKIAAYN